jgi:hypothetical protein
MVSLFLRNDSDCKDVDLYNTRKRDAVTESSDVMRNISWLVSCFSIIKKPNKHFSGNQSVIAGACILTRFPIFIRKRCGACLGGSKTCKKQQNYKIKLKSKTQGPDTVLTNTNAIG